MPVVPQAPVLATFFVTELRWPERRFYYRVLIPGLTAAIDCCIERLPEEKREVFHLVYEMDMSLRDAADELDIPEGTVKSRLHYAKRRLAREWRNFETDTEEEGS